MGYLQFFFLLIGVYLIWIKVVRMYLRYWHFKKQGMETFGFPLPLLGNIPALAKINLKDEYIRGIILELIN